MIRQKIKDVLLGILGEIGFSGNLDFVIEVPPKIEQGHYATNLAMTAARILKKPPMTIAQQVVEKLAGRLEVLEKVEIAKPGFINFFLKDDYFRKVIQEIDEDYGKSALKKGWKWQIEFVSANPVGPLNVVNARAASVGDTLANLLAETGYEVEREFYVNDVGTQIDLFGESLEARYFQTLGKEKELPSDGYQGDYVIDLAKELVSEFQDQLLLKEEDERRRFICTWGLEKIISQQKKDLQDFAVSFDRWFYQHELYNGAITETLNELGKRGFVSEKDGAVWFSSTELGDDKDRVLIRSNGEPTYFAADIAYHLNKFSRGFDKLIDLWGPDHHGHIKRMKNAVESLGRNKDDLEVLIIQLVSLRKGNEQLRMSKRMGEYITIRDLLDEISRDAARFFFIMRGTDSPLDFDLELAKKESLDNPVYYVQYAHARISSILRSAPPFSSKEADYKLLTVPEELELCRKLREFPYFLEECAQKLEVHHLTRYAQDLAAAFHSYYSSTRVLVDDLLLAQARLSLAQGVKRVLAKILSLMKVTAPEKM